MKQFLLFTIISLFALSSFAQTQRVTISKKTISTLSCQYTKRIDLEKSDTLFYVYIGFQNEKYKILSDRKSLMFSSQATIDQFISDLKAAVALKSKRVDMRWDRGTHEIYLYEFSPKLYISEPGESGHTTINLKAVKKLILWLETIKIGEG